MFLKTKLNENISKLMSFDTDVMRIDRDSISSKEISIFDHYNVNPDDILQGDELKLLISDIKKADINNDGQYSKKEIRKFLKSTPMDKKMSVRKFNEFIENITYYSKKSRLNESNGQIESFFQLEKSDCWLLSGIKSLSLTSWGKKAIKDSILDNNDEGTYTVKLNGVNFETIINQEDIDKAREEYYSIGDLDVLLIELATERYLRQEVEKGNIVRESDVLEGSSGIGEISAQYLLTGEKGFGFCLAQSKEEKIKETEQKLSEASEAMKFGYKNTQDYWFNTYSQDTFKKLLYKLSENNDTALTCSFKESRNWFKKELYDEKDINSFDNLSEHAYVIKNIEKDENNNITNIILINPHDSDILIKKSLGDFLNQINNVTVVNIDDDYEKYKDGFEQIPVKI
ncbi:MAG: hypothetical protein MJ237_06910 [bacterium]|nr:hypothetical protein [bacterium]